ncbi:hypothetical protein [Pseudoxanthomonas yeongjuensis]|uniref:hypothetical protein n=1 Tax=Pseudoxanthomonas yeongjuensis TaxID=377616 RepID=UPI001391FEE2|nr:hypothetical protein [Pseudoxanthomonas yeongjuensis]
MPSSDAKLPRWRQFLRWVQHVFLIAAVLCIGGYLSLHWTAVANLYRSASVPLLVFAALWLAMLHPLTAFALWRVQFVLGIERVYSRTLSSYVNRLPARFIPGGIWHSLARYADIHDEIQASAGHLARLLLADMVAIATGAALASGALGLALFDGGAPATRLAILMMACGGVGCFSPLLLFPNQHRRSRIIHWIIAVFLLGLVWVGVGVAFTVVAKAFGEPFFTCPSTALVTTYTTAASVGNFAIFAPQGWGVTDAVFALLQPCPIQLAALLSAILALRLVTIVADIATWSIGRAFFIGARGRIGRK